MPTQSVNPTSAPSGWLKSYYFTRFVVSAIWVALAFTVARAMPPIAAVLLVAYPAWDALANFIELQQVEDVRVLDVFVEPQRRLDAGMQLRRRA